jgi:hypothetical protein
MPWVAIERYKWREGFIPLMAEKIWDLAYLTSKWAGHIRGDSAQENSLL